MVQPSPQNQSQRAKAHLPALAGSSTARGNVARPPCNHTCKSGLLEVRSQSKRDRAAQPSMHSEPQKALSQA